MLWLDDAACREPAVAGGKGASLARLASAGLPVPPGFVVTAHEMVRAAGGAALRAALRAGDGERAQALARTARPPRAEVERAYGRLGGRVAVRSSAVAEDSAASSYAGQHDSYLDVEGADDVCRRIADCWASYFGARALAYRARLAALDELGMAVVVQRMVPAERAGVLFTIDPLHGGEGMVAEAVTGSGERLVAGLVTPDHYELDREGAVVSQRLPGERVLDAGELRALAALGRRLETVLGGPQDVEWALCGTRWYVLQSRPVTTLAR